MNRLFSEDDLLVAPFRRDVLPLRSDVLSLLHNQQNKSQLLNYV